MTSFLTADGSRPIVLLRKDFLDHPEAYLSRRSVDVVVTSPPYNLGTKYGAYDDSTSRGDYILWIEQAALEVRRALRDNGSFFLNMGSSPTSPWGPFDVIMALRDHFTLQNTFHWIKSIYVEDPTGGGSNGVATSMNVGHYKPINSKRFVNDCHEYIFHLTKNGDVPIDRLAIGVPFKDPTNLARWRGGTNRLRCRGNVWYIPYETIQSREKQRPHPASFPSELAEMCIKLHGYNKQTIVLDPFMGIGNTALACQRLNVGFLGCEIDSGYHRTAVQLLKRRKQ